MKPVLQRPLRILAYAVYCGLDHGCWLVIHLLSGRTLMRLASRRPWQILRWQLAPDNQKLWKHRIRWLLRTRCRRAGWGSTCLSRSFSGRLLLDLIGVANELHLGMSQMADGSKVPHAWLQDPLNGEPLTPGLGSGAPLIHF